MAFQFPTNEPPSYGRHINLTPLALNALKLSNVDKGHKLVVYADYERNREQIDAFLTAGEVLGAETMLVMTTPATRTKREPLPMAVEAMRQAETVIDLTCIPWIYRESFSMLLNSGVRILISTSNPDTWTKMPPTAELAALSQLSARMLDATDELRVTSALGTDLTLNKAGRPGACQDGVVDKPGEWDNFPSMQAACAPLEDKANGTFVIAPGDLLVTMKKIVSDPITCTVKDGRIVDVAGGSDAALVRNWLARWDHPDSYTISHIGWGLEPRGEIASMQTMEWESYAGGTLIAFGSNDNAALGGRTKCPSHLDIVLLETSFSCDGTAITEAGKFVHPDIVLPEV